MKALFALLLFSSMVFGQFAPSSYQVAVEGRLDASTPEPRLISNVIIDIVPTSEPNLLWLGTGDGVTKVVYTESQPGAAGFSFQTYGTDQGLGKGGTSGLLVTDSIIWASFAFDTSVGISGAGGGLAYSRNSGVDWTLLPQPRDRLYRFNRTSGFDSALGYWPTTTNVDNISYDIAASTHYVWIASKGGGLRRHAYAADYTDYNDTTGWRVVSPLVFTDGTSSIFHPGDPAQGLIHRPFAVLCRGDTVYVGTAQGIIRSTNDGQTWNNITAQNTNLGLSGNFVTALAYQDAMGTIWAATWRAEAQNEFYGVSKSSDGGVTWHSYLDSAQTVQSIGRYETVRAHSLGFSPTGDTVYVCDDLGLWKSPNGGRTWDLFRQPRDDSNGQQFYETAIYSTMPDPHRSSWLWVGGVDGLALSQNRGADWTIFQAHYSLNGAARPVETYAYPNPWSPQRYGPVKMAYHLQTGGSVQVTIYDFAMSKVVELPTVQRAADPSPRFGVPNQPYETWDGKKDGTIVANGTYFYKIEKPGGEVWGKIIVLD
jgi:hypothetical protein